jgi:hypothetical protein
MIVLDRLLTGGLRFVLDKIATAVDAELDDPARLQEELLAAQMRHELGEIDEAELAAVEETLLARMRELRAAEPGGGAISFTGAGADAGAGGAVEIEVGFSAPEDDEERADERP